MHLPTQPILIALSGGGQEVIRGVGACIHAHRRNHLVEQHTVNKNKRRKTRKPSVPRYLLFRGLGALLPPR